MEKSIHGAFLTVLIHLCTCYGKTEYLTLLTFGKAPPFRQCCSHRLEQILGSKKVKKNPNQHLIVKHKCFPDGAEAF